MARTATEWQSAEELAEELAVPLRTIYVWRSRGQGPRAHKIGRHLRYRRVDVEAWLDRQADTRRSAS